MCSWKTANTPVSEFLLVKNIGSSSFIVIVQKKKNFIVDFFIYLTRNDVVLTGQPSSVWKLELCFVVVYLFQRSNFLRSPVTCTNGERPLCFCWVDLGVLWDGGLLSTLGWMSAMWKRGRNWVRLVLDSHSMFRVVFFPMISPFWVRMRNPLACPIVYSNIVTCIICKMCFLWNWWTFYF